MRLDDFRAVLDHAPDGVLVECGNAIAYMNAAYARMLGYEKPADLATKSIRDIALPDELDRLVFFGRCREEGKPAPTRYTFRARSRSGDVVTLDASISAARSDGDLLITTIVRPVHEVRETLALPGTKELSPREREVVTMLLEGKRSKEIALHLDVSEKTIWTHRSRAFQKLGVRGANDLFRMAYEHSALSTQDSAL